MSSVRWARRALASVILLATAGCAPPPPPNIVVIVVDTLRYDHLPFYGYDRDTAPVVHERLARRGAVVEEAYAQAPWTLPSVASMLTGLPPAAMLDENGNPWGIPEAATTLAERLEGLSYQTAAFVANPTVHGGNGFAQGFQTFYTPPYELSSLHRHADDVRDRAISWLKARASGPFFLYVHFLDPHDPYDNPDLEAGRSRFKPDYSGRVRGHHVHGLYLEALELEQAEDLEHLKALYDSEIRYVDRAIGELLDSLGPEVLAETLVIFTSDHGEELFDHGGWKHGETLYEEQIHVPLVARWDGRIAAGSRLSGTVRLMDLFPTLLAAAGGEPSRGVGVDLLPSLSGDKPLPLRPAFSSHLSGGPRRASMVMGGRKLVLFDRYAPFAPKDDRERALWERDRRRLRRLELYDLAADPMEARARLDLAPELFEPLLAELDPWRPGLRLLASGLHPGGRLVGRLTFAGEVSKVEPWLLGPDDSFSSGPREVAFELVGDGLTKGLFVHGDLGAIESWELDDGAVEITLPKGVPEQLPIRLSRLMANQPPELPAGPALRVWAREHLQLFAGGLDEETRRRLRALGYAD